MLTRRERAPSRGSLSKALMSSSAPPTEVQSSSHSVETSHERSAGNIRFGNAPFQKVRASLWRQVAACCGPASTSTYRQSEYKVTFGTSGRTMSSAPVSKYPSHQRLHDRVADCELGRGRARDLRKRRAVNRPHNPRTRGGDQRVGERHAMGIRRLSNVSLSRSP
jgi:hypothetical protein